MKSGRAILARHRPAIAASATGLAAIAAAAVSGASYVSSGHAGACTALAALTGVALLCYLVNLLKAVLSPAVTRAARSMRPHHADPDRGGARR